MSDLRDRITEVYFWVRRGAEWVQIKVSPEDLEILRNNLQEGDGKFWFTDNPDTQRILNPLDGDLGDPKSKRSGK